MYRKMDKQKKGKEKEEKPFKQMRFWTIRWVK